MTKAREEKESLQKALNNERAKNQRLQRENFDLKKERVAKEDEHEGLSDIILELVKLARMNYWAMLESRTEIYELLDHPEIKRQPAIYKALDTPKAI